MHWNLHVWTVVYRIGPPPVLLPGLRPSWNCSWKLSPSSNWLDVSSPGFVISSTNSSASTMDLRTSRLLPSQSRPPMNISNKISKDLCNEKTKSSSQTTNQLFTCSADLTLWVKTPCRTAHSDYNRHSGMRKGLPELKYPSKASTNKWICSKTINSFIPSGTPTTKYRLAYRQYTNL